MKVIYWCMLSALLAGLYSNLYGQALSSIIQGKISTETNSSAESATIVLLRKSDSSIAVSGVVGKNGLFKLSIADPGDYLLLVTKIGFERSITGPYHITKSQILALNTIVLKPATKQLNEVSIAGIRPEVEVRPGKIILNIQNSIIATGNSAFDILRESPGVHVDNSNNISIIGRQSALITIDGKPTNLSGDDLVSVLRSMQSGMIDRIELITAGSAKEDAAAGGIINIVLKKGNNTGTNATVTLGAGYGKYYKDNAGIVFNDRTEKLNIFGNYNYSDNKSFHDFTTDRVINFDNVTSDYHVNYNGVQISKNNTFGIGADYAITPNHTIGFLVNGSVVDDNFVKDNDLNIYNQSVFDSTITANSNVNRHISKINYNLNYNGKLDSAGKTLTANFNYNTFNRASSEYITNDFFDADNNTYRDPLLLQNISPSNIHSWIAKADFTDPLSKTSKLEAGVKYSNVTSNNDLVFGPLVDGQYTSDPAFSNHFVYTENVNAAYVNYNGKFNKVSLEAGLRAEQTIAKGNSLTLDQVVNSNYTDLFPHASLLYDADSKHQFSLIYSRGITRPKYEDLNPFLYYVDLYDYKAGNPTLKPEYSNSIELSYNYNKTITTTLYASILSNAYEFNFYEQNDSSKVNINTNINLGRIYTYGIKFFTPVTFTSWWNANFNVDAAYLRYVAYPVNGNLNKGTQYVVFSSGQYFLISKTLTAEITGRYESPTFYGVNQFKANYTVDAGISQQLFNKRGSLRLSASDIFNTLRDRAQSTYGGVDITTMDKKESQVARLTFIYRFGKTTLRSTVHRTGNEDELKRTTGNN